MEKLPQNGRRAAGGFLRVADANAFAHLILRMKEELNRIMAESTGQNIEKITDDTDRDFYMSAAEAKDYGLIDKVLEKSLK